ncbi:MAG TPA: mitochondrial fission ELM1 family protein [Stellaceae bacterium]|nr:mitochondrial fission ELM1 family protein [Stellaceae bacterium]
MDGLTGPGGQSSAGADEAPEIWALHDGKAGMRSQVLGLAEATGFAFIEKVLTARRPWVWLPPRLWLRPLAAVADGPAALAPPWPDLVIGCGRNTAAPALAIRRASRGRTLAAQVQDPRIGRSEFDLMVIPAHDRLRGPRVVVTSGAVHRVTPERLAAERRRFPGLAALPRPIIGVLIGGANRAYTLDLRRLGEIAGAIGGAVRRRNGSVVVTPSRRSGPDSVAVLRRHLGGLPGDIWDGAGDNPYYAYLAVADALLVTADSVSMISEAAATGKPVHIIELAGGDRKFARFHDGMRRAGITRPFAGDIEAWSYTPPDDTARAGATLRALLLTHRAGRRPV